MSVFNALNRMAEPIGFDIGMADSHVQANFFNGFAQAFVQSMSEQDRDMQAYYIDRDLTPKARKVLREIASTIEAGDAA
ncbi:hypothetical protein U6G28_02465 [Actinomycetaceae bacterium MB13-C1-2]|nr:hypothetical protein U6G28_02465 [Actinomycetaceae bacterium MB13-C1-2]